MLNQDLNQCDATAKIKVTQEKFDIVLKEQAVIYWKNRAEIPYLASQEEYWQIEKIIKTNFHKALDVYEVIPVEVDHPNKSVVKLIQSTFKTKIKEIYYGSILNIDIFGDWCTLYTILKEMGGWHNNDEKGSYLSDSFMYEKEGEPTVICNYCEGDLDFEIKEF